jgi:hypothetical protein
MRVRGSHTIKREIEIVLVISGSGCSIPLTAAAQSTDGGMKEDVQMGDGSVLS